MLWYGDVTPPAALLGRGPELAQLARHLGTGRSVVVHGPAGTGVGSLLRYVAAADPGLDLDLPRAYLHAGDCTPGDLLRRLVALLHPADGEPAPALSPGQCAALLAPLRVMVVLDGVRAGPDDSALADGLVAAMPGAVLLFGSDRPLPATAAQSTVLRGLPEDAGLYLLFTDQDHPLTPADHAGARRLWAAVGGHPGRLRRAAALARSGRRSFAGLARAAERDPSSLDAAGLRDLPERDREILEVLALAGGAPLPAAALAGMLPGVGAPALARLRDAGLVVERTAQGVHLLALPRDLLGPGLAGSGRQPWSAEPALAGVAGERFTQWLAAAAPGSPLADSALDAMQHLLRAAVRDGDPAAAVRLVRAGEPALTASGRLDACAAALDLGLAAARQVGDRAGLADLVRRRDALAAALVRPGTGGVATPTRDAAPVQGTLLPTGAPLLPRAVPGDPGHGGGHGGAGHGRGGRDGDPEPASPSGRPGGTGGPERRPGRARQLVLVSYSLALAGLLAVGVGYYMSSAQGVPVQPSPGGSSAPQDGRGTSTPGVTGAGTTPGGPSSRRDGTPAAAPLPAGTAAGPGSTTPTGSGAAAPSSGPAGSGTEAPGSGAPGSVAPGSLPAGRPAPSTGGAPGPLVLRLDRDDLGEVHLGPGTAPVTTAARLLNAGPRPLERLAVRLDGPAFTVLASSCGSSLAPGASCTVALAARPRSLGPATGTLTAATEAGTVQAQVRAEGVVDVVVTVVVTPPPTAPEGTPAPGSPEVAVRGGAGLIDCAGRCTVRVRSPGLDILALEAVAGTGARFSGWEGSCSGPEPRCSLELTADRAVTARFAATPPSG